MKILFAATPAPGHLNPILAIARMARARGDEVLFVTTPHFAPLVEAIGARFVPLVADADFDYRIMDQLFPERASLPPGPAQLKFDMERVFLDKMAAQAATLRAAITVESPDVIVVDNLFCGTMPLILDSSRPRPPIVACGITFLALDRPDGAPGGLGLPPARTAADRVRYAAIAAEVDAVLSDPIRDYANRKLAALGLPGLPGSFFESLVLLADAYLQLTVPTFEYDFGPLPPRIHFVGALPAPPRLAPEPDWWDEVDGSRPVVLVTQGTVANHDFSQLVEPTLAALADRDDLLVLVTTGGRPVASISGPIPANTRLARFLDYGKILPKVDLLVTNGGYATVSLALRAGVPIVSAGLTEDKAEIGARIAWSGVGVNLATNNPTVEQIRDGVNDVFRLPTYRERARAMAASFATVDTPGTIFAVFDQLVAPVSVA